MILPFKGTYPIARGFIVSDSFMPAGLRDPIYGATHRGIDYALPVGTPLFAPISGKITYAAFSPDGAGNTVVINGEGLLVKHFHMNSINVRYGQMVNVGDPIGTSGATGNVTGPHLHLQVERNGVAIDPNIVLQTNEEKEITLKNPTPDEVRSVFRTKDLGEATQEQVNQFSLQPWDKLLTFVVDELYNRWANTIKELGALKAGNAMTYQQVLTHWQNYKGSDPTEKEMNDVVGASNSWGSANGYLLQFNYDLRRKLESQVAELQAQKPTDAQEKITKIKAIIDG